VRQSFSWHSLKRFSIAGHRETGAGSTAVKPIRDYSSSFCVGCARPVLDAINFLPANVDEVWHGPCRRIEKVCLSYFHRSFLHIFVSFLFYFLHCFLHLNLNLYLTYI